MNFNNLIKYIWPFITGVFLILWINQCNRKPKTVKVPFEKKIYIDSIVKVFDTVKEFVPVKGEVKIDTVYLERIKKEKDTIVKDSLIQNLLKINEYNQVFEDTVQNINVYSKVRGVLLGQSTNYNIKPREFIIKDTFEIPLKSSINTGLELGLPIQQLDGVVVKGNIIFINKKGNSFSFSYDSENRFWIGGSIKIF